MKPTGLALETKNPKNLSSVGIKSLSNLGLIVTVCLAARCRDEEFIVTVSDRRLTYDEGMPGTDDAVMKFHFLADGWWLLYSGNNLSHLNGVIEHARNLLIIGGSDNVGLRGVRHAVCAAYQAARNNAAYEAFVLPHHYATLAEFYERGLANLGEKGFTQITDKIAEFDLGLEFLVFGFSPDTGAKSHIFDVVNPGFHRDWDLEGFGIIGSGWRLALGSITSRHQGDFLEVEDAVYRLCEAKFTAESAPGVGVATTVFILRYDGQVKALPRKDIQLLRETWDQSRRAPIPANVTKIVRESLGDFVSP